jgi:peptide/nickel transport system substrate-binding protein
MNSGWGPDWANPSTIIPELLGAEAGFNLSRLNTGGETQDQAFEDGIQEALVETDQDTQIQMWADLNTEAVQKAYVVPRFFTKTQRLHGSDVGGAYIWAPYGSWSYGNLYVMQ